MPREEAIELGLIKVASETPIDETNEEGAEAASQEESKTVADQVIPEE